MKESGDITSHEQVNEGRESKYVHFSALLEFINS